MLAMWAGLALLVTPSLPLAGAAPSSCTPQDGKVSVRLDAGASSLVRLTRQAITLEGASCARIPLARTEVVALSARGGNNTNLDFVLGARVDGRVDLDFVLDLADAGNAITLQGGRSDEVITTGPAGARFAAERKRIDILASGVDLWDVRSGRGDDTLRTGGSRGGPLGFLSAATGGSSVTGPNTINGGPGNDTISGTDGVNVIWGGGGNDTIYAKGGDDEVQGGSGNDVLWGGPGDDLLNGGEGDDREFGADSNDVFMETPQTYYAYSGSPVTLLDGQDTFSSLTVPSAPGISYDVNARIYIDHPDTSELTVSLIAPNNRIVRLIEKRANGTPSLMGTQFDSEAFTNVKSPGTRDLRGRFHPEWSMESLTQFDPTGTWKLRVKDDAGGASGSLVHWNIDVTYATDLPNGNDEITGGGGTYDLVSYAARTQGVTVTAAGGIDDGQLGEFDAVGKSGPDIEAIYGGNGDDHLSGTDSKDDLRGLLGHDTLIGLGNNDQLRGGNGQDTIDGGFGADAIHGNGNPDTIDGGPDADRIFYWYSPVGMTIDLTLGRTDEGTFNDTDAGNDEDTIVNVENVNGTEKADTLIGDGLRNGLVGAAGDDYLDGAGEVDRLEGAGGFDTCVNGETLVTCEA